MQKNRIRNNEIIFRTTQYIYDILKDKSTNKGLSQQDYFINRIMNEVKYIDTSHRVEMKRTNRELNLIGKKINNISVRMINENIYDSDVNFILNAINQVIELQNNLDKNLKEYFKSEAGNDN